jgi:uncharacterized protein (DUF1330 family)
MTVTLCVLLWARPGRDTELIAYEDRVLQLLGDHGGRVLQRARREGSEDGPLEMHLLQFPSEEALSCYMDDERRAALSSSRDRAVSRTDVIRVDLV